MRKVRLVTGIGAVMAAGALLACQKRAPTTVAAASPAQAAPATAVAPPPIANTEADRQADVLSQDLAALNKKGYLGDAFFDFDKANLRDDARAALAKDGEWLQRYGSVQVLLEGHCDDRGTEAYNLALGERRAGAAREYLVSLGVPESRIKIVSYGKERPFCTEQDESCWQENRRDHVLVTAK
jgi:peptidoglycan-associated lipoprotein